MNNTSNLLRAGLLAFATVATAFASGEGWTSDFDAAKKQAASEKKDLLLDFTGSDWCGWCIKLDKEVFQEAAFKTGVKDKLVLVELDYPKDQSKLTDDTKAQNEKLKGEFKPKGYPTIMLCDASGKPYAQTGYQPGGPEKYLPHLAELMAVRTKRDEAFAAADQATAPAEKAKQLLAGLQTMDAELVDAHYADVLAKITELDPDTAATYTKGRDEVKAKQDAEQKAAMAGREAIQGKMMEMQKTVEPLLKAEEFDKAFDAAITFIKANPELPDQVKIGIPLSIRLSGFVKKGDAEGANKFIDEFAKEHAELAPQTDMIKAKVKDEIEKAKAKVSSDPKPDAEK